MSEIEQLRAAVERVRAIHYPTYANGTTVMLCANNECDARPWPCDTGAALDGAPEPEAERDAATAAIERVRALVSEQEAEATEIDMGQIVAALDGAPE